jgi:FkbM family methyltransferase
LLAATANTEIDVFAFEPLLDVQQRLRLNIESNDLADRVHVVPAAASDRDGVARFFRTSAALPTSSSLSAEFMRDTPHLISTVVPVVKIDTAVENLSLRSVDLVKIDVEAMEHLVLGGMRTLVCEQRPDIICEILPTTEFPPSHTEWLRAIGYQFFLVRPDGLPRPTAKLGGASGAPNFWLTANPER